MPALHSVEADTPHAAQARALFLEYRGFLETVESHRCVNFSAFEQEVATLPAAYTGHQGEVLLAAVDEDAAACIAYRSVTALPTLGCEIKRLYVRPRYRGLGLGRILVADALSRASARGFKRAILDTDLESMKAAYFIYLSFGFKEYKPAEGSIHYLELTLTRPTPA